MSYAQAKELALLRLALRQCWAAGDRAEALGLLAQMTIIAGIVNDNELVAELRRWAVKLG